MSVSLGTKSSRLGGDDLHLETDVAIVVLVANEEMLASMVVLWKVLISKLTTESLIYGSLELNPVQSPHFLAYFPVG